MCRRRPAGLVSARVEDDCVLDDQALERAGRELGEARRAGVVGEGPTVRVQRANLQVERNADEDEAGSLDGELVWARAALRQRGRRTRARSDESSRHGGAGYAPGIIAEVRYDDGLRRMTSWSEAGRTLRVLVLVHEELNPTRRAGRLSRRRRLEDGVRRARDAPEIGSRGRVVGLHADLAVLGAAVERFRPDVLFNLLEDFHGVAVNDQHWVSHLELLGIPYTGCNPRGLLLSRDKALAKKLLRFDGVRTPWFAVCPRGTEVTVPEGIRFPAIVKSLIFDGSVGISQASVVRSEEKLLARVRFVHREIGTDAIVEEFIDGRELYVGMVGTRGSRPFPCGS